MKGGWGEGVSTGQDERWEGLAQVWGAAVRGWPLEEGRGAQGGTALCPTRPPRTIPHQTPRSSPTPRLSGAQIISAALVSDCRAKWHLKGFLRVSLADGGRTVDISLSLRK